MTTNKCMTCGCDDLGNDHHYISDVEKCSYCIDKGQGPCWDGYEYAGTKEQDGKTVPNCIPVKRISRCGKNFWWCWLVNRVWHSRLSKWMVCIKGRDWTINWLLFN